MDFTQVILEVMQYTYAEDVKNVLFADKELYNDTKVTRKKLKEKGRKTLWKYYHNEGIYREWYPNGNLKEKYKYVLLNRHGGRYMHGLYQSWYKNGQIAVHQRYSGGSLIGLSRKWDESGKLIAEVFY
jgi:antitoxin component YwqK of YwqJK toxin-antitoxin module